MPSPFPGMNPYLEQEDAWHDFHEHYCVMVSRAEIRPRAELWPLSLQDRLPIIPIPLRPPDPDVVLDIQAVLHPIYDRARYQTYVYDGEPEPPLSPEEADWARQFVPPQTKEPA